MEWDVILYLCFKDSLSDSLWWNQAQSCHPGGCRGLREWCRYARMPGQARYDERTLEIPVLARNFRFLFDLPLFATLRVAGMTGGKWTITARIIF
jgi:hypothetical protein